LLNEAVLDLDELLLLALTLALGLTAGAGEEDLLLLTLDKFLRGGPLLVGLGSLVGLAHLQGVLLLQSKLLLGLLSEVVGVRDGLILRLCLDLVGGSSSSTLSSGILLVGLGNRLGGLLILQLGLAFGGAPGESSLLVRTSTVSKIRTDNMTL
jgi:hypothetical protein